MRIFRNKPFSRFARHENIRDQDLCEAIARAEQGLIDADLGGGVIKQRIPRPHEGRSGGFRTLVAFRSGERAFFLYGFAKNERDNIRPDELKAFRELGQHYLGLTDKELQKATKNEKLTEVKCHEKDL